MKQGKQQLDQEFARLSISRKKYLERIFDMVIADVMEWQHISKPNVRQKLILRLKVVREGIASVFNADESELNAMANKLSRKGKAGSKKGTRRNPTEKRQLYENFRKEHGHNYEEYINWCNKNDVLEKAMYTKDSFKKVNRK